MFQQEALGRESRRPPPRNRGRRVTRGARGVSEPQPEAVLASGPPSAAFLSHSCPLVAAGGGARMRALRTKREPRKVLPFSLSDDGQIRDVRSGTCRSCQTRLHPQDCERVAAGPQPPPAALPAADAPGRQALQCLASPADSPMALLSRLVLRLPPAGGDVGQVRRAGTRAPGFLLGMKMFGGWVEMNLVTLVTLRWLNFAG